MGIAVFVLVLIGVLVAALWSLFVRRHGESESARPDWRPTNEVFRDPSTDRVMRVWLDRGGERHYVAEPPP